MVWSIPNTFIAGTKARAAEVNENFTSCKSFVDSLEAQAAVNETDIANLESSKAELNGDYAQRFQVADATNSFDAVNKQTLVKFTANSREYITGLELSKQDNTTIAASAGAAWDSTYTYMIQSSINLTKTQAGISSSATYYVYITADEETGTCELVISLSDSTPELPSGFEYFRRLGYFTTDSNAAITDVFNDSGIDYSNIVGFPDYTRGASRVAGTTYTANENGWLILNIAVNPNSSTTRTATFVVNNSTLMTLAPWKYYDATNLAIPLKNGDTYRLSGDTGNFTNLIYMFYPFRRIGG